MKRRWKSLLAAMLIGSMLVNGALPVSAASQPTVGPNEAGSAGYYSKAVGSDEVTYHPPVSVSNGVLQGHEGISGLEMGSEAAPNSVIGPDTRMEVENTLTAPYRSIAVVVTEWPHQGNTVGTAFFIGPDVLATAGHNLFDPTYREWASKVTVYPGATRGVQYFGYANHTNLTIGGEWGDYGNKMDDWGLIHIDSNLGNTTGWMSTRAWTLNEVIGRSCMVTGYPEDLMNEDKSQGKDRIMYTGSGQIIGESFRALPAFSHDVDTEKGDSGAPVYGYAPNSNILVVYGIHNNGRYDNYEDYMYNHAVLINDWLFGAFVDATN